MNIWGFLTASAIGAIAKRVLAAVGVGVVSYVGFDALLSFVISQVQSYLLGLPLAALQLAGLARLDIGLNIIFSAYSVVLSMMILKRLVRF